MSPDVNDDANTSAKHRRNLITERFTAASRHQNKSVSASGDVLYLAVRDVSVDGIRLEGKGVDPDIIVERSLLYPVEGDPQLQKAIEEVVKLIK